LQAGKKSGSGLPGAAPLKEAAFFVSGKNIIFTDAKTPSSEGYYRQ
jgi:hypothetical protein